MSDATLQEQPPASPPRRRWLRRAVLGALAFIAIGVGWGVYVSSVWDEELHSAIADADRSDLDWRLRDQEAKRPVLRDEENSSVQMGRVKQAKPAKWPIWYFPPNTAGADVTLSDPNAIALSLEELRPPVRLTAEQERLLRAEMKRGAAAVAEARKLIDFPRGRHVVKWRKDVVSSLLPQTQESRDDVAILRYDVLLRCQDGDLAGALDSTRASWNASCAVRDEPFAVSQLVRIACRKITLSTLERILAQGEPDATALADFQRLLEEEDREEPFLVAMKGERGLLDGFLDVVQHGGVSHAELRHSLASLSDKSAGANLIGTDMELILLRGTVRRDRADTLRRMNRLVEIAQLSPEQQGAEVAAWEEAMKKEGSPLVRRLLPWVGKVSGACRRSHAEIRCMCVVLALERFRRDTKHWPSRLDELTPHYISAVPLDPFDGKPVKYVKRDDGVTVYSVGADGEDNGGNLDGKWLQPGSDWGYRLWDVDRRRQPAPEQ